MSLIKQYKEYFRIFMEVRILLNWIKHWSFENVDNVE